MTISLLRNLIIQKAGKYGCIEDVEILTDLNAVRFIQAREGYSQCFGREVAYKSNITDQRRCEIADCYWGQACNNYRLEKLAPVDKAFPQISQYELDEFLNFLSICKQEVEPEIHGDEVGLQILSYKNLFSATRKMLVATPKTLVGENIEERQNQMAHVLRQESWLQIPRLNQWRDVLVA